MNSFTNTFQILRLIFKREKINTSLWIVSITTLSIVVALMLSTVFDESARQALIVTIDNPAMIAMLGPIYGLDNYTTGAMYFNMMVQWMMIAVAIMNVFLVIRHTRQEEESGRLDILLSLPVGRHAVLLAIFLFTLIVNLILAILSGVGIALLGIESMTLMGALFYGLCLGMVGLVFAAISAIFAQLCSSARKAIVLSMSTLGFFYLLRGAGDIGNEMLSFVSPLGLVQRCQAFVSNQGWPFLVLFIEFILLGVLACVLNAHRDAHQGYLPTRKGKEKASRFLLSPLGLAYRLLRMPFWGWLIGMFIIGAAYGSILGTIDTFVESNEFYSMMIGVTPDYSISQMFVSMVTSIMAFFGVFAVLSMMLKLRSEEKNNHYLNILSRPVSRTSYMASYVIIALIMSVLIQCVNALGIYVSALLVLEDVGTLTLGYLIQANLVYLPALWILLGIVVLLLGVYPKGSVGIWLYAGFNFFVVFMGRLPDLVPEWLTNLTPFGFIPNLPMDTINWTHLFILTLLSIGLMGIGFIAYQKRDIQANN